MSEGLSAGLARWSQRKLAARRHDAAAPVVDESRSDSRRDEEQLASRGDVGSSVETLEKKAETAPATFDASQLPPIDELTAESDYTGFLAKGVPEALTRAALRKLWLSDPVLANLDGLNNYDEDYNVVDQIITAAQTSYRPGLGYFDEIEKELSQLEDAIADAGGDHVEAQASSAARVEMTEAEAIEHSGHGSDEQVTEQPQVTTADQDSVVAAVGGEDGEDRHSILSPAWQTADSHARTRSED